MPIHDAGYRRYSGPVTARLWRWLVLVRTEFKLGFRNKWLWVLYFVGIVPFLVFFAPVYIKYVLMPGVTERVNAGGPGGGGGPFNSPVFDPMQPEYYYNPTLRNAVFLFILYAAIVGTGIVARDKRANAMELYLARSIGRTSYFLGKWGGVLALHLLQFVVPTLVLWLSVVLVYPDWGLLEHTVGFMPQVLGGLVAFTLFVTFLVTAVSSCTDSPAFAALIWLVISSFLGLLAQMLRQFLASPSYAALSPWLAATRVAEAIGGLHPRIDIPVSHALASVALYTVLGVLLLRRGLRVVEVAQ